MSSAWPLRSECFVLRLGFDIAGYQARPDPLNQRLVREADPFIQARGRLVRGNGQNFLSEDIARVYSFIEPKKGHTGALQALQDGPRDRSAAATLRQEGGVYPECAKSGRVQ
jgi:hypothetical protein